MQLAARTSQSAARTCPSAEPFDYLCRRCFVGHSRSRSDVFSPAHCSKYNPGSADSPQSQSPEEFGRTSDPAISEEMPAASLPECRVSYSRVSGRFLPLRGCVVTYMTMVRGSLRIRSFTPCSANEREIGVDSIMPGKLLGGETTPRQCRGLRGSSAAAPYQ